MRTLASLLVLVTCAGAQSTPASKDEREIRNAIEDQARKANEQRSGEIWSERGPFVYHVYKIELLTSSVAAAEADGVRAGTFPEHLDYLFILTRANGGWRVARRIQVCKPVMLQPLAVSPRSSARGSSGCLN